MADEKQLIRELDESEKWLSKVCQSEATDCELNVDRLKRHVRLAVQEAWLARQLKTDDCTTDGLTSSISSRVKQLLTQTDARKANKTRGASRWLFQPWRIGALATAAVIGIFAVGIELYHPSAREDSYVLLDSLIEDSPFSNDIDTSLTVLAEEFDDMSWTLQNPDDDIDGDIQYTYDQFDATDFGDTLFSSVIES